MPSIQDQFSVRRGRGQPVAVLVLTVLAPLSLFMFLSRSVSDGGLHLNKLGWHYLWLLPAVLLIPGLISERRPGEYELRLGVCALLMTQLGFYAMLLAFGWQWPAVEWHRFVLVVVLTLGALWLVASDWSRSRFLLLAIAAAIGVGGVLAGIGQASLAQQRETEGNQRIESAKRERNRLKDLGQKRRDDLNHKSDLALGILGTSRGCPGGYQPEAIGPLFKALKLALNNTTIEQFATRSALTEIERCGVDDVVEVPLIRKTAAAAISERIDAGILPPDPSRFDMAITKAIEAVTSSNESQRNDAFETIKVELALYRAAATGKKEDEEAAELLLSTPVSVQERTQGIPLLDALVEGPEAVVASGIESASNFPSEPNKKPPPVIPGPLGWVLLGISSLAMWNALLRRNARQLAGPVVISPDNKVGDNEITELRIAVLQNVAEPGAAPGSDATTQITTLLDLAGPASGMINKIMTSVLTILGRVHGYEVCADLVKPTDGTNHGGPARVLVRVKDLHSKKTLAVELHEDDNSTTTMRSAGLWAAGYILERSNRIPSWAAWNAESARALAEGSVKGASVHQLKEAIKAAPDSGILLCRLGLAYELTGTARNRIEAINIFARAVGAHPYYLQAQYRLAASLGMLAAHDPEVWIRAQQDSRDATTERLMSGLESIGLSSDVKGALKTLHSTADKEKAKQELRNLAKALFSNLERQANLASVLAASLRKSERESLWPLLGRKERQRYRWLIRSARLIHEDQSESTKGDFEAMEATTKKQWSGWQISYNAACAQARYNPKEAIRLLEQCLVRPGVHQLKADWVRKDPDLMPLRNLARFEWFCNQLESD